MAKKSALAKPSEVFEGFVRHPCGWINVSGKSFVVGAGCPKCGERITAVEKLSEAEVKELLQQTEELEDNEDEDADEDEDAEDDDSDDGDEDDDDSD